MTGRKDPQLIGQYPHSMAPVVQFINNRLPGDPGIFKFTVTFTAIVSSNLKTNIMRKNNWFYIALIAIILATGFFVLTSSASEVKVKESPTCCKKKATDCGPGIKKTGNGDLIMENMSRQFISIPAF